MKVISIFFLVISAVSAVLAQSVPPDPSNPAPQQTVRDQIVVTASGTPETVATTPAAVSIITREDIEQREARDVSDLLREVPGVAVTRTGSLGKSTSIFIRGGSSKQALVLWNGIEINDPYFSGYDWGRFSTVGVERVEVARGPFSSLYGADAMSGVVNIITADDRNRGDVDLAAGGRGLMNAATSFTTIAGSWKLFGAAEHQQDNGFASNDNDRENSLLGGVTLGSRSANAGINGRYLNFDLGIPTNTNFDATAFVATPHHRQSGSEWELAAPLSMQWSRVRADVRVGESHRDDRDQDPDSGELGKTLSTRRNARGSVGVDTVAGTLTAGGALERDVAENSDTFGLDLDAHHRSANALFIEDRYSHSFGSGQLEVSAGARRDHYTTFGTETSPRIAAAWSQGNNKFRAGYGEAFRAPQIGELYLPFFGNPDLKAERSHSAEIGYDRYFGAEGSISITAFNERFKNLITYDFLTSAFQNIGESRSRGIEFSASDRRGPLNFALSYTYLRAIDEATGQQLARRPKHSGSLAIGYAHGLTNTEIVVQRVGNRPDVTDLAPFGDVINRAYTVVDITEKWVFGRVAPYAKVENLMNTRYEEAFGYPSPRRRAIVGIRYGFGR